MTRVLLVCEYPTLNGGEHSLLTLLPRLAERGIECQALAPSAGPLAGAFRELGIPVLPLETFRDGKKLSQEAIRAQIAQALASQRPDLLHANSLSTARSSGPVAKALGIPSIGHLRDIVGLSAQAVDDINCHTRLLAVSHATREYHLRQGFDAGKTFVAYNGVDLVRFAPRPSTGYLHAELGLPADCLLIGTVGQLVLRKGHDVLADAAMLLAEDRPELHYVIVGDRYSEKAEAYEHEAKLRRQFDAGPLAGHAHFLGRRNDMPELLAELTMLVHPARQEPLGRVLLEAGAARIPIVATDVGGTREIIPDGGGVLVPPDAPAALANGLTRMLDEAAFRQNCATVTLEHIRQRFSAAVASRTLFEHYEKTLAGHSGAGT